MSGREKGLLSAKALQELAMLFATPIYELDGAVLTGDRKAAARHASEFGGDLTGLEAFVNHYHLTDFTKHFDLQSRTRRANLEALARAVVTVWSERLQHLLGERTVLFYVGGKDDLIVRFHVERSGAPPWAPLDRDFLRKERMSVFRAARGGFERLV